MLDEEELAARNEQKMAPFRHLWELDDPQWMKERKEQWRSHLDEGE